jgi:putative nucleotidyltransferase with HDIG domain
MPPVVSPVQRILDQVKELPTAPPVVFKLMSLLKKEIQHNNEIVDIIRYDEYLTAKLLKLCNSAFFKATQPVNSLDQVVLRLGYSNILSVAISLKVGDVVSKVKRAAYVNPYDLWRHSVTSAVAAKMLGERCRVAEFPQDLAFTAGLLHDIGKVVLNACMMEEVTTIHTYAQEKGIHSLEAERQILGTDHAELGGALLESWKLAEEMINAVRFHAEPEKSEALLPSLCHLASACAHICAGTRAEEELIQSVHPIALERLALTAEEVSSALELVQNEALQVEAFMMVA